MSDRLVVTKTHKLFINGQFPRSESGRSIAVNGKDGAVAAHLCRASRKDLRDAVVAARAAQGGWASRSAYNRGQILYRISEMLEGRRAEFEGALADVPSGAPRGARGKTKSKKKASGRSTRAIAPMSPAQEVEASIDRLVAYAGWADKYAQVLGCNNSVNGPFYNFTVPEPTGVVGVVAPDEAPLLGLVSLIVAPLCAGSAVVALGSQAAPIPTCLFGEVCATSDVPPGVINLLTGLREELIPHFAGHRDIDAIHGANLADAESVALRSGASENVKRVTMRKLAPKEWLEADLCESPWWIERFVEMKTIWHPAAM